MRLLPFLLAGFLSAAMLNAQAQMPQIPRDSATDDLLDPMLAGQDLSGLERILTRPADSATRVKQMNWLKRQVHRGGNFFLSQMYAGNLWAQSQAVPLNAALRREAMEMLLYSVALVRVDGAACQDRTAPERRLEQVRRWHEGVLKAVRALPKDNKDALIRAAQRFEQATAPRRTERDDNLCRGGVDGLLAGLSAATVPVQPQPGQITSNITLSMPRGWRPAYLPPGIYKPRQAALRKKLRATLAADLK